MDEHTATVVIGGGQAGLAAGYHLARLHQDFVILDERERVGDAWRERYDSLRLFSPARADGLPGRRFPAPPDHYPTGAEMADFLEEYATAMRLPVRQGVRAQRVRTDAGGGFVVDTDAGSIPAERVVVATGGHRLPRVPELAGRLRPGIVQLHSSAYRNPGQLREGPVLVVGASHSGADLALEVAATHRTYLSGRIPGEVPFTLGRPSARVANLVIPPLFQHVLTLRTPFGRRLAPEVRRHGGPLIRVKKAHLDAAGVELHRARTVGVSDDGMPVLDDGRVLEVCNVLWCTGYTDDFTWVGPAPLDHDGFPVQRHGVVEQVPGLYFLGLPFQFAFASMLVLGAGRDAEHVARHIAAAARQEARATAGSRR